MSLSVSSSPHPAPCVPTQLSLFPEPDTGPAVKKRKPRRTPGAPEQAQLVASESLDHPARVISAGTPHPLPDQATTCDIMVASSVPAIPIVRAATNLAEVLDRVSSLTCWPERKQQDVESAVRAVGRVLGQPLSGITTDVGQLRMLLTEASPALASMTPDRWMRVRSLLITALRACDINVMPGRSSEHFSPEWATLFESLADRKCRHGLSRVVRYFSSNGVASADVTPEAFALFSEALTTTSLRAKPATTMAMVTRLWQKAAASVPGWPALPSLPPAPARRYALPLKAFPESFRRNMAGFLAHTAEQDPFAENYAPSVRATTVEQRRKQILQIASALAASGQPVEQITSLAVLVAPTNAKAALRHLLDRRDGQKGVGVAQQAQLLRTIGQHWVRAPEDAIQKLRGFSSALAPKKAGMSKKNRDRLRQFDVKANVDALLGLLDRVLWEVERAGTGSHADALRVMFAVAVEILLVAPMRLENLCGLDMAQHLIEVRRSRTRYGHISIGKTKTQVSFERSLPADTSRKLEIYINTYRPRIASQPGSLLFPGRTSNARAPTRFSTAISEFIYRETGLVMNPHLFRHLAVKLHLDRFPDDMETARLILGHTSSRTTERSYAENRSDNAFRRWDQTLALLRNTSRENQPAVLSSGRSGRTRP